MAKILVVDDQESMRFIISSMLKEKGHEVKIAEDGLQALAILKDASFDLIVADVNMPRLNGLEFLKQVKEKDRTARVILLTGLVEETVRLGAEKYGLDGLILKPFEKTKALEIIEKILAR
jgi:CheY-like chemotaxis protein